MSKDLQQKATTREWITTTMTDLTAEEAFQQIRQHCEPEQWDENGMRHALTELKILLMKGLSETSGGWSFMSSDQMGKSKDIRELFEQWIVRELNKHRPTSGAWNKVVETHGMWVVCKDGSIDYGPREFYSIPPDWHQDEYFVPHVMRKRWAKGDEMDLLVAFGASARIQGIKSFTIGSNIW